MSLMDDIRAEREREGITEAEWLHRDRGLYAAGRWSFESLRHPAAIKAAREAQAAARAKHQADLDYADDLMAESPPWWIEGREERLAWIEEHAPHRASEYREAAE